MKVQIALSTPIPVTTARWLICNDEPLHRSQHPRPQDRHRPHPLSAPASPAMPGTRRAKQIGLTAVLAALDFAP
ncbi:unannotated protein [freshwater metagenome]|uniref:Unannotated protein n=1 Tax=freshwater metagenome TaxID=449393 RepID=A0A6J6A344_9ZZZZ